MAKTKICVIGKIYEDCSSDGQGIKIIELIKALKARYGADQVSEASYYGIKDSKTAVFRLLFRAFRGSEHIVLCARGEALTTLVKACIVINKLFGRRIYYVLVGGALPEALEAHPEMVGAVASMAGILPETETVASELRDLGLKNVRLLPNFKYIRQYAPEELKPLGAPPYKLIFMSRISEFKGVPEMIETVRRLNSGVIKYTLDMYGLINPEFEERFAEIKKDLPPEIRYRGICNAWKTVEILHDGFVQLFPTKCPTEGQPASLIDGFFAGIPVVSAQWNSCADMVREGETGLTFPLGDFAAFEEILRRIYDDPSETERMRPACLEEAKKFLPEIAAAPLFDAIEK